MSLLARSVRPVASTSRLLHTSAVVEAAKKAPAKPAAKKRQGGNFGGARKAGGAASGPARIKAGGLTLKSALAHDAPDLSDLMQLYPETMNAANVGKPAVIPRNTLEQLQVFGLPRRLSQELLPVPTTVLRCLTLSLPTGRVLLAGARGSGKSHIVLQTLARALSAGHIVLSLPSAVPLVDSSAAYAYNARTRLFDQPALACQLLDRLGKVNRDRLKEVRTDSGDLGELVARGARDEKRSVQVFEEVFAALASQTQFDVVVAVDDAQALFRPSAYRAPDYTRLEPYHLSVPALLLEYIAGRKTMARGTLLLALSSLPQHPAPPSLLAPLGLPAPAPITAYTPLDPTHVANAEALQVVHVGPMGKAETAGMYELWRRRGWARGDSDEALVAALAAAAGNPLELGRSWRETLRAV
ncbi:hypothetical protein Q5752_005378 [Cryptotrichosporon argae]